MAQGGHPLMWFPAGAALFFTLITAVATAGPNQFVTRYLPIGISGSANLLAVDASGSFFIVAMVEDPSGQQQIRVIKTDSQGNELASLDLTNRVDY